MLPYTEARDRTMSRIGRSGVIDACRTSPRGATRIPSTSPLMCLWGSYPGIAECFIVPGFGITRSDSSASSVAMWLAKWQWKIQFPLRVGAHVIDIVWPGTSSSVTVSRRSAGAVMLSRAPSPRESTR